MSQLYTILDEIMVSLWMLTYTLAFIGTVKYKYPSISPITQAIIAPFEFSVMIGLLCSRDITCDYVFVSYAFWTFIEIAIIVLIIYNGYITKKKVASYLIFILALTSLMCYLVIYKGHMFFFSYFNTFIGEIFWLFFILKKEYPMRPINLLMFVLKFIADILVIPVYFYSGIWISSVICVMLPALDLAFIIVYFSKKGKLKNAKSCDCWKL